MSWLKHQTLPDLLRERRSTEKYINTLRAKLAGQTERLKWIEHYIEEKCKANSDLSQRA